MREQGADKIEQRSTRFFPPLVSDSTVSSQVTESWTFHQDHPFHIISSRSNYSPYYVSPIISSHHDPITPSSSHENPSPDQTNFQPLLPPKEKTKRVRKFSTFQYSPFRWSRCMSRTFLPCENDSIGMEDLRDWTFLGGVFGGGWKEGL